METFVYFASMSFVVWLIYKLIQGAQDEFDVVDDNGDDDADEFDLLTVSEKFEVAKQTNDSLHGMEQLATDLDLCSDESIKVIEISWVGDDGENHKYDLYCDGTNTATECMRDIAQRETYDLRRVLSYQCNALAKATRHRKNGRKNDIDEIGGMVER